MHAVSRTQQGKQIEPIVKTLRCPLSPEFWRRVKWRHSTPHFASTPERRNENINVNKYLISTSGIESTTSHDWPQRYNNYNYYIIIIIIFMEKNKANELTGHLMVSDHRLRSRVTP